MSQNHSEALSSLASWLEDWLNELGLSFLAAASTRLILIFGLVALAILIHLIFRKLIIRALMKVVLKTATDWDDALARHNVFTFLAHLVPGAVLYFGLSTIFNNSGALDYLQRGTIGYMIIMAGMAASAFLSAIITIYDSSFEGAKERPILSYIQVAKVVLWLFVTIMTAATLLDREPWALLGGLGAMTAVLLLVFRDAILGLVASIQLAGNDMVRVGDWIEMPHYGADGDVVEISLTTVKIQNWDKTITTIPSYKLIQESFKNWRGMSEAGGRRIKRSILIDIHSIRFADAELLERLRQARFLNEHIESKLVEIEHYHSEHGLTEGPEINRRNLTNIGLFRAYLNNYMRNHPMIHQDMTRLVRQLAPTEKGLPIEIYVFSKEVRWAYYENIQGDIFDHILATAPEFDLAIMQIPSGNDLRGLREHFATSSQDPLHP